MVLAGCHIPGRSECCWCSGDPLPGKAWGWLLSDRLQPALAGAPPFGRGGIASLSPSLFFAVAWSVASGSNVKSMRLKDGS